MDSRLLLVWLHVLIGAVWYGGLMTALVGVRAARSVGAPAAAAALLRRFQRVAWAALAAMLATGLLNMMPLIPAMQASGSIRSFMWTLTMKVGLFGAIVAVTFAQQWVYGRAFAAEGHPKALAGYLRLARVNLLLGAAILFLGLGLSRGGLF
jgi:putative copper export protein